MRAAALARSFARIHWQNLVNIGVLPLEFENLDDYDDIAQGKLLTVRGLPTQLTTPGGRVG